MKIDIENIKCLAVDDFAFLKRFKYGTAVIDHDTHKFVKIISSRDKKSVADVLKNFINVKIVTRDRSSSYGNAIKEALPKAEQIADYFHLLENLTDKGKLFIRDLLPEKIYFTENFELTKNNKKSENYFLRNKIEGLMYHKKKFLKNERKMFKVILKKYKEIDIFIKEIYKLKKCIKNGKIISLKRLIKKWEKSEIDVLRTYTRGINQDKDAVLNAAKYTLTNGLAEGKINKIKTIKRMMYGRASAELLKARLFLSDCFHYSE